jgi:hypothetical protein
MLSGRGLCDELITRPDETYRMWGVVCDIKPEKMGEDMARVGPQRHRKKIYIHRNESVAPNFVFVMMQVH